MFGFGQSQQPDSKPASASEFAPETDFASSGQLPIPGAYVHPIHETNATEYLFIVDPMAIGQKQKARPVGSFGPLPMRTGYDKFFYGTGAAYFAGFLGGGAYGAYRGLQVAQGQSFKIQYNSMLNSIGRQGPRISNSMGVLTMGWALLDNWFHSVRDKSDYYNHIGAAFLSGAIFKSTAGIRPALISGSLMSAVVGSYGLYEAFGQKAKESPAKIGASIATSNEPVPVSV